MRQIITLITICLVFISCGQNDTNQKESAPKEKELTPKQVDTVQQVVTAPVEIQKTKEQLWDDFWISFTNAVNQRDKKAMIELSLKGPDFFDGGGGGTAEQWINVADNTLWKYWQAAVKKGVKPYDKTNKITKNGKATFRY